MYIGGSHYSPQDHESAKRMCGIAGLFDPSGFDEPEAEGIAVERRDRLVHRGLDNAGIWLDGVAGIALAHRRLSILDLSPAGHQPMVSASGRYVLVFNGEIYNHLLGHGTRPSMKGRRMTTCLSCNRMPAKGRFRGPRE
ncbi:MAG: hypothetical protein R6U98_31580 [Pirellulaceae bacterium]